MSCRIILKLISAILDPEVTFLTNPARRTACTARPADAKPAAEDTKPKKDVSLKDERAIEVFF